MGIIPVHLLRASLALGIGDVFFCLVTHFPFWQKLTHGKINHLLFLFRLRQCHDKWTASSDPSRECTTRDEDSGLTVGPRKRSIGGMKGNAIKLTDLASQEAPVPRTHSGIDELDRVLGGGLVPASAILVGGDPGIGKSTLLLQAAARFSEAGLKVLYISGEEASAQVRMRAQRLGLGSANVQLGADTNLRNILTTMDTEKPDLVIIDSIQTMWADTVESAPAVCPKCALRPMN